MAGEYYKWLARDVKPEEKRELTREEKIKNWWYYHKWHLLIAAVVAFVVLDIAGDILSDFRNQPDYSVEIATARIPIVIARKSTTDAAISTLTFTLLALSFYKRKTTGEP